MDTRHRRRYSVPVIYLHPLLGSAALILTVWLAMAGLRSRHQASYAAAARRTHRRLWPYVFGLVGLTAVGGTASVVFLRDDLSLASTNHFLAGWGLFTVMAVLWGLSRAFPASWARQVHLLTGFLCLLVGITVLVLGFDLLP